MTASRKAKGAIAERAGAVAEEQVARHYESLGAKILATRYRTQSAEIDLIAEQDGVVIFVEVKRAETHAIAAERIGPAQQARIIGAASVFLESQPAGQNTACRLDAALVDGQGRIQIIENAFEL